MKRKLLPLLGVIVIAGIVFWVTTQKNKTETPGNSNVVSQKPNPKVILESASKISWNLESSDWPEKATIYKSNRNNDSSNLNFFLEQAGLSEKDKKSDDPQITFYTSKDDSKNLYITKESGLLAYSVNIEKKSDLGSGTKLGQDELKRKFEDLINTLIKNKDIKIKVTKASYQKMLYPEWVEATATDAQVVEFKAVFQINGNEVVTFYKEPISARYSLTGKLIKLEYTPLPTIDSQENVTIKTLDELKATKPEEFKIWSKEGNTVYNLSEDKSLGETITITSGRLVEIMADKSNVLWPYFMLEGNAISTNGPVKVYLITPANK